MRKHVATMLKQPHDVVQLGERLGQILAFQASSGEKLFQAIMFV
ncbi:hypothetical protein [Methylobacter sp. BlB1]|nr:hypothetical protein [Methylobacter sp. BlB1]